MLTKTSARHLHELEDLDDLAAPMGAQRQTKGGGALALAVAGVDDQQPTAFALGLVIGLGDRGGFNLHADLSRCGGEIRWGLAPRPATRPIAKQSGGWQCADRTPPPARGVWPGRHKRPDGSHGPGP